MPVDTLQCAISENLHQHSLHVLSAAVKQCMKLSLSFLSCWPLNMLLRFTPAELSTRSRHRPLPFSSYLRQAGHVELLDLLFKVIHCFTFILDIVVKDFYLSM